MHDNEPIDRSLVLGGGGSVGNAWLIGVIAGLQDAGLDVTDADQIVGTSAGATAALQITNTPLPELYAATLAAVPPGGATSGGAGRPPAGAHTDPMERTRRIIDAASDADDMRRRMGALFIESDDASAGAASASWRRTVAGRLTGYTWPATEVLIPAVDADSGECVTFSRRSGVDLIDAVAASSAGASAYRIGEHRYIDGGYRRNENADLAAGAARVLVLSPLRGRTRHPLGWRMQLEAQAAELTEAGSRIEIVAPDTASLGAFGGNMMDLARRAPSARAGFAQGRDLAPRLGPLWRG